MSKYKLIIQESYVDICYSEDLYVLDTVFYNHTSLMKFFINIDEVGKRYDSDFDVYNIGIKFESVASDEVDTIYADRLLYLTEDTMYSLNAKSNRIIIEAKTTGECNIFRILRSVGIVTNIDILKSKTGTTDVHMALPETFKMIVKGDADYDNYVDYCDGKQYFINDDGSISDLTDQVKDVVEYDREEMEVMVETIERDSKIFDFSADEIINFIKLRIDEYHLHCINSGITMDAFYNSRHILPTLINDFKNTKGINIEGNHARFEAFQKVVINELYDICSIDSEAKDYNNGVNHYLVISIKVNANNGNHLAIINKKTPEINAINKLYYGRYLDCVKEVYKKTHHIDVDIEHDNRVLYGINITYSDNYGNNVHTRINEYGVNPDGDEFYKIANKWHKKISL